MSRSDADRWDARYAGRSHAPAAPPDALARPVDLADLVPTTGRALDVACGAGGQSLWLAERGLDVVAVDVSAEAVELTRRATEGRPVDARVVDLDDGLPAGLGSFDVVVCQRFRMPSSYASFVERTRAGGLVVVTVLSTTGTDEPGPFHAPGGELASAFDRPDCTIVRHAEGDGEESVVVRVDRRPLVERRGTVER